MLGEVEGLLYSDRKKGTVADYGVVHTLGLGGLSNLGWTDLKMGHGSLAGYHTHLQHSLEELHPLEVVGTCR